MDCKSTFTRQFEPDRRLKLESGVERMARRTKLNDKVQTALVKLIEKGVSIEDACQHVGITDRTFYSWTARGEAEEAEFVPFLQAVTRARVDAKIAAIDTIRTAMSPFTQKTTKTETFTETRLNSKGESYDYKRETVTKTTTLMQGDWRAAIDYLKRRYPGEWSDHIKVDDWRSQAIADIKAGLVQYEPLAEAFDESLAAQLFREAGVPIPSGASPASD